MSYAFPLRLPCIPAIPAISGSLVSSCYLKPPPTPPPGPYPPALPPLPGFGCYGLTINTQVQTVTPPAYDLTAAISYPDQAETGICKPQIDFTLKVPDIVPVSGFTGHLCFVEYIFCDGLGNLITTYAGMNFEDGLLKSLIHDDSSCPSSSSTGPPS